MSQTIVSRIAVVLTVVFYSMVFLGVADAKADSPAAWKQHALLMEVKHDLPVGLLVAVCTQESNWKNVAGTKGEIGVCQIKPDTARMVCGKCPTIDKRLWDPRANIEFAAKYLAWLRDNVSSEPLVMMAAYNGGHNHAVVRYMVQVDRRR